MYGFKFMILDLEGVASCNTNRLTKNCESALFAYKSGEGSWGKV